MLSRRNVHILAMLFGIGLASPAASWDPWGDITNPGRIFDNIVRETENAGREIDRMRLEANAVTGAVPLQIWLEQSRATARPGAQPIPDNIKQAIGSFFEEDIYQRVLYKVGDAGAINLGNLAISYGERDAIVLIDTIIFANNEAVQNVGLWVHELQHVKQFRDWGTRDFAISYLRSWNSVEEDANAATARFLQVDRQRREQQQPLSTWTQNTQNSQQLGMRPATICRVGFESCQMLVSIPQGTQCYCQNMNGIFFGISE